MSLGTILLVVLILMLIGAFPTWPHSQSWGYLPSGGLGLLLLIVIILLVLGSCSQRVRQRSTHMAVRRIDSARQAAMRSTTVHWRQALPARLRIVSRSDASGSPQRVVCADMPSR